ncbi:MAG: type IV-A pilus assembly ATPase PilB [Proteobacteria bacterium]|jgi:type IV pilus assembly protein PilB|nr:type IV-A pilus assembly ATPase PilB [Pseudomonadota bacterium]
MNDNLNIATSAPARNALSGLPQRLVADGVAEQAAVEAALAAARDDAGGFVSQLVRSGGVSARDIATAASAEFGVPLLDLDAVTVDPDIIRVVNDKLLLKFRVLPLFRRGNRLFVGVSDPTNLQALDEIKFQTGMMVEAIVCDEDKLQRTVTTLLEQVDNQMPIINEDEGIELDGLELGNTDDDIGENISRDDIEDAPIVRFVNKLMLDAIRRGASDIHFEPFEKMYRVRMRVDGVLREVTQPPVQLGGRLAARIKVMSRMDIAERRVPQDGRIKLRLNKARAIDFRVSTCPTLYGEKVVMRILDASQAMLGIDALGYEGFQKDLYLAALAKPQGMILVTGPTGSGKTVSLYTGLGILNRGDLNISTAEDPVEINLQGINQVNVNNKVGLSFAAALRAFLRQDPDVVMVGEIRDLETAEIALKAAQTGHLVLSTLHTNDAPQTLTRLIDMGVKPYALATSMSLIIAQRLARRLCQNCRELLDIPADALRKEGFPEEAIANGLRVFGPRGCDSCTDGYKGRIGVYQVMPVTDEIGRLIMAGGNAHDIADAAKRNNIWDLRRSGLAKVMSGLTSIEEINSVTIE